MTATAIHCAPMTADTRAAARTLLASFLESDSHYRASATVYGDGGAAALERALDLFLAQPQVGFVWLATTGEASAARAVGACVVCRAISTSRGTLVAKLDDVTVDTDWQGRGVGARMLTALAAHVHAMGMSRIDCGCHRTNARAWRFYEQLGFRPLDEERLAWLL